MHICCLDYELYLLLLFLISLGKRLINYNLHSERQTVPNDNTRSRACPIECLAVLPYYICQQHEFTTLSNTEPEGKFSNIASKTLYKQSFVGGDATT
jgi:hypothetical protein